MRITKIAFNPKTLNLNIEFQLPNQARDGWIKGGGEGKFDPGAPFTSAFEKLDPICAFTHELITREFETVGGLKVPPHPIQARTVHFYYKAKSALREVMIPGVRQIDGQPGTYSLPGVKRFLHDGEANRGDLFLSEEMTAIVEAVEEQAKEVLPRFLKFLGHGHKAPTLLDQGQGDGAALPAAFDDEVAALAVQTLKTLSQPQLAMIRRCAAELPPPSKTFRTKGKGQPFKKAMQSLITQKVVVYDEAGGVMRLSELGHNIHTLITRQVA